MAYRDEENDDEEKFLPEPIDDDDYEDEDEDEDELLDDDLVERDVLVELPGFSDADGVMINCYINDDSTLELTCESTDSIALTRENARLLKVYIDDFLRHK